MEDDGLSEEARKQREAQSAQLDELRKAREARAAELQVRGALKQILEPDAFERLANIRAANASLYAQLAQLFLYLQQKGQLKARVSDAQLKEFVSRLLAQQRKETKIVMHRK
jgi:programmed cell death protein 5